MAMHAGVIIPYLKKPCEVPFTTILNIMSKRRFAVAPMLDWTNRHCRYFHRLFSRQIVLYTEMITTDAILRGPQHSLLDHHPVEQPVALQLGGSDPKALAACAKLGEQYGYNEINLNVGCPSDRV